MANSVSSETSTLPPWRSSLADGLRAAMESLVLVMILLSPWAFGAVDPRWEFWLTIGIAGLLALWASRILIEFRLGWQLGPVAVALIALMLLALWQMTPMPGDVLAIVSPRTAQLYDELIPAQLEEFTASPDVAPTSTGAALSVSPHATRRAAVRLLALLVVFLAVRNVIASPASLWRLSVAGILVGTALSLLAIIQVFTSPPNVIYWSIQTESNCVFGPFISRNHFPDYANFCFGLGAGLLLSRFTGQARRDRSGKHERRTPANSFPLMELLQEPAALWIAGALILIGTGIVFSASRGGALAFLGGAALTLTLLFRRSARFLHLGTALAIVVGSVALLAWFGLERVQSRLGTLVDGEALKDERIILLSRTLPLVRDFPILGTGFGSLDYVEPMYREDAADAGWSYQHAHNEYLEALIEGGVVRLVLTVLAIGLVFRCGLRALRATRITRPAAWCSAACLGSPRWSSIALWISEFIFLQSPFLRLLYVHILPPWAKKKAH